MDLEASVLLGVYQCTGKVRRKQVRSELDTAEISVDSLGKGVDGQSLRKTRDTFEKDVAVGEQTYEQVLDQLFLTYYDLTHLEGQQVHE